MSCSDSATCVRPSVGPSVTLVDCDHMVQQKVEIGTLQDKPVSWLHARGGRPVS